MNLIETWQNNQDYFFKLLSQHLWLSFVSIMIALIIGVFLGILIHLNPKLKGITLSIVNVIYTIPSIALFGFMIAISGIGQTTAIIALSLYGLLPMVRATDTGLNQVDPEIIEAARAMGSTRWQILVQIRLPLALPYIATGFRNMVVMTTALAGISAFIGAGGLGEAIFTGITTNNTPLLILGSLLVSLLALSADFYFGKIEKWIQYRIVRRKKARFPIVLTCLIVFGLFLTTINTAPKADIVIGSKPQTEQYILVEILKQMIEEQTDLKVKLTGGIGGGTSNIHPAMLKGDIDMYPEYTGTSWLFVLKNPPMSDQNALFKQLQEAYAQRYNMNWYNTYGFNNTYTLIIDKEFAKANNIKTFSDLSQYSQNLRFGAEFDFFEREDGFNQFNELYQFQFKSILRLDINLKYQAFNQNEIDVMLAFTTDALINQEGYQVLIDDQQYFPSYYAGTVINQSTLDKYPQLKPVLDQLTDVISNEQMAEMNYQVDVLKKDIKTVAKTFIEEVIKHD